VRQPPLVLTAESRSARIQLELGGTVFGCHSPLCQKALSINTPHLVLGQGQTLQEGCNGKAALYRHNFRQEIDYTMFILRG